MATRRGFLRGAAVAAATIEFPASAICIGRKLEGPISGLLVDEGIPQSGAVAVYGHIRGIPVYSFRTDPANLWFGTVRQQVERGGAIAGITSLGALFFLERLGWDSGLRVMLRVDHSDAAGWHHASAGALPAAMMARLHASGPDFGACAAELFAAGPAIWRDCTHAASPFAQQGDGSSPVSWVLAPSTMR